MIGRNPRGNSRDPDQRRAWNVCVGDSSIVWSYSHLLSQVSMGLLSARIAKNMLEAKCCA